MNDITTNLAEFIKKNISPITGLFVKKPENGDIPYAIIPDGMTVKDLKPLLDSYKEKPDRRKGQVETRDTRSHIDFTNRFKEDGTVLFAIANIRKQDITASLTTVFNYHPKGDDNKAADNADFKAVYNFPISKQFQEWFKNNSQPLSQAELAHHIEDNISDITVADPSDIAKVTSLKPKFADTLEMLELAKGLEIRQNETVTNQIRLQSGEANIQYSSEHTSKDGTPLVVPNFFLISIPVFEGEKSVNIPVRLRYRVEKGSITWIYDMYNPFAIFTEAFDAAVHQVVEATQLPCFNGKI